MHSVQKSKSSKQLAHGSKQTPHVVSVMFVWPAGQYSRHLFW